MNTSVMRSGATAPHRPPRIFSVLLALIGLALALPGAYLASLGGSWYYIIGGVVLVVCAFFLFQGRRLGAWLYAAFFLGTLIWSLCEVGLDLWALIPRLGLFVACGAWLLMPWVRRTTA